MMDGLGMSSAWRWQGGRLGTATPARRENRVHAEYTLRHRGGSKKRGIHVRVRVMQLIDVESEDGAYGCERIEREGETDDCEG